MFVRSKWRQSKWAPRRIEHELTRRGVRELDRAAALQTVFGSEWGAVAVGAGDGEEHPGGAAAQLRGAARRQLATMRHVGVETRRRRFVGWFARRGHSLSACMELFRQLEAEGHDTRQSGGSD